MDGILIPILGVLVSGLLGFVCLLRRPLRCYLLAALVSPSATSVVFLLGGFVMADMNPAREYGAAYIPTGKEHDPTRADYVLWLSAVLITLIVSAAGAYLAQRVAMHILQGALDEKSVAGRWFIKHRWFGLAGPSSSDQA